MDFEQERWRRSIDQALESFRQTAEFIRRGEPSDEGGPETEREDGQQQ